LRLASRGLTQHLVAALSAAAALAGCGSSAPANTRASAGFTSRGDAICNEAASRIVALQAPSGAELASAARLLGQELPIAMAELSSLRSLSPPSAQRAPLARYLGIAAQEIALARTVRGFALADDAGAFHGAAAQLAALTPRSDEAADAAGLTACARASEPHGQGG
jgi:hypothetical protein